MPAGIIVPYAGASLPAGFLNCNGAAVSRTTYSALFAALGVTWGAGDGSTTFNLPDLRGRALIGVGTGSGLTARALAASGGEEAHQLSVLELASHLHKFNQFWDDTSDLTALAGMPFAASQYALQGDVQGLTAFSNSGTTGNDNAHNNMQPWAAAYWIVKT
jgi:microcystin-dependent protein